MDQKELPITRILVCRETIGLCLTTLQAHSKLSLDTETTGLRPHHGDRIFSLIIGCKVQEEYFCYYFNFNPCYEALLGRFVLSPTEWPFIAEKLFKDKNRTWFLSNAKYDMAMLANEGCEIQGTIHCTQAQGRIEYNEHMKYGLDAQAKRLGYEKDTAVEDYIDEHKLWEWKEIPGKRVRDKIKHFDKVPFELMYKYACTDAALTYHIGECQEKALEKIAHETPQGLPTVLKVADNERRLTKTVFNMEYRGLKIDRAYTVRAASYESDRMARGEREFLRLTGRDYKSSPKLFAEIFASFKSKWEYTDKGNPSFESETLEKFGDPVSIAILGIRDAKSRSDFYHGFLHHADSNDFIHPNFNPDGTATGRFSSSNPNFQNLTSDEEPTEFPVRRAIIPGEEGGFILKFDQDQVEYRLMLELACRRIGMETPLVKAIKGGLDVHQATANLAAITRFQAKTTNFLTIYGGGNEKLADGLRCSVQEAREIRSAIFDAAPEIRGFIKAVVATAEERRYIFNWAGRRSYFPDPNFCYTAPNRLIQGGCADIIKFAMPPVEQYLLENWPGTHIILQVHDELDLDVPQRYLSHKLDIVAGVKGIMENIYPSQYLPLTCGAEWSQKSLGDLEEVK